LTELEARRLTKDLDYEMAVDEWKKSSSVTEPGEEHVMYIEIDHEACAEQIDIAVLYGKDASGAQTYIGKLILEHIDSDDDICDKIAELAVAHYPNELNALDFVGEAFFHGGVIALSVLQRHAALSNISKEGFNETWKDVPAHSQIDGFGGLSDIDIARLNESISRAIAEADVPAPYRTLLDKLAHDLGLNEQETLAFNDGFRYMYGTGNNSLRSRIDESISEQVELAGETLDDELLEFFRDL
jgi:hypothetical protein